MELNKNDEDAEQYLNLLENSFSLLKKSTDKLAKTAIETTDVLNNNLISVEKRLFSIIDNISDIVIVKNHMGYWLTVNEYTKSLFDIGYNDFFGKTSLQIDKNNINYTHWLTTDEQTDEIAWEQKKSYRYKNCIGGVWYDIAKTPIFDKFNNPKELITIGRNINDIINTKFKEKACFRVLNTLVDPIVIIDNNFTLFFYNDSFELKFQNKLTDNTPNFIDNLNISIFDIFNNLKPEDFYINHNVIDYNGCVMTINHIIDLDNEPVFFVCAIKKVEKTVDFL